MIFYNNFNKNLIRTDIINVSIFLLLSRQSHNLFSLENIAHLPNDDLLHKSLALVICTKVIYT